MVSDGRALLQAAERTRPDLVITDISMPEIDGIEATRRLRASVPGVRVLILSIHTDLSWVQAAFEAGACGYLTKTSVAEEIELAVREVSKGRTRIGTITDGQFEGDTAVRVVTYPALDAFQCLTTGVSSQIGAVVLAITAP